MSFCKFCTAAFLLLLSLGCQGAPGGSTLPAGLQSVLEQRLHAAWRQALPSAQQEAAQWQVEFMAPRGAAATPCPTTWDVDAISLQRLTRVSIPVRCEGQRGSVVAQLQVHAPAWSLRADTPAGHTLREGDLVQRPQQIAHRDELLAASELLGRQLKTDGKAGQRLGARHVLRPVAMRKGDKIEIRAQGDGVQVSVMGIATGTGKLGDTVTVRNARTGRPVKGKLIAPGVLLAAQQAPSGSVQIKAAESAD